MGAPHKDDQEIGMNDMKITDGVAGEETRNAEGQEGRQTATEGTKDTEAGEDVQVSVGVARLASHLLQAMVESREPSKPALSAEEEGERLLAAYAEYAQPNAFKPGQLIIPKRLGAEKAYEGVFGVVLVPNAEPGPKDAPYETLRVGCFRNGCFRGDGFFDPHLFQPYVPSAGENGVGAPETALAGEESTAQ
jgi:hypothetical protein